MAKTLVQYLVFFLRMLPHFFGFPFAGIDSKRASQTGWILAPKQQGGGSKEHLYLDYRYNEAWVYSKANSVAFSTAEAGIKDALK